MGGNEIQKRAESFARFRDELYEKICVVVGVHDLPRKREEFFTSLSKSWMENREVGVENIEMRKRIIAMGVHKDDLRKIEEERNEIILQVFPIMQSFLRKSFFNFAQDFEDLSQSAFFSCCQALDSYLPEKGPVIPWFWIWTKQRAWREVGRCRGAKQLVKQQQDQDPEDAEKNVETDDVDVFFEPEEEEKDERMEAPQEKYDYFSEFSIEVKKQGSEGEEILNLLDMKPELAEQQGLCAKESQESLRYLQDLRKTEDYRPDASFLRKFKQGFGPQLGGRVAEKEIKKIGRLIRGDDKSKTQETQERSF